MLAGESKPVSLYSDKEDTEHFSCGYILGATQEDVVLCSITPNGLYDGFLVLKTANICTQILIFDFVERKKEF